MVMLIQGDPTGARPLFVRAVALQREIGDPQMLANFLSNLGDAARELDDLGEAARCYRESLALSDELGERWLLAYLLEDVAMLAAAAGTDAEAVSPAPVLAAAARQLRNEIGAPLPRESQHRLDERLRPAVRLLARARYGVLSAEGAALTLQQAVEMADEVLENLAP
jgi:tetratricopeptide (TPR) repeat protein